MIKKDRDKLNTFFGNHLANICQVARVSNFKIGFSRSNKDDKDFKGDSPATMTMDTDYEYLTATLRYNNKIVPEMWKDKNYDRMISTICHEVAHIITGESFEKLKIKYKGDGRYYQERLTEQVGRLIESQYQNQYIPHNKINKRTGK